LTGGEPGWPLPRRSRSNAFGGKGILEQKKGGVRPEHIQKKEAAEARQSGTGKKRSKKNREMV